MSDISKYIYGVVSSNTEKSFNLDTRYWTPDTRYLSENRASSIEVRAYTICFQDISAVVSDAKIIDYTRMSKDALARLLLRHQEVIEKVMANYTIIPMKLGTFAKNKEEVEEILAKGHRTIKDIFERAKNTIEIDVAATFNDFDSFLQEISKEEEIKQLKQSLLSKKGGVTVDDQMKVGVLVKKHLGKKREKYAEQIQSALNRIAQGFKAHDLMDDKMVVNTAFLIDRGRRKDFEQEVDGLNNKFEEKLNFRCVGPLPPYSFYTLEVKKAQFKEVDWARKKLGLKDNFITANDIKKAHRRLALTCHPDKNPDTHGIEKKFDDMTRAYRILLDYYRASNPAEETGGCYFNEEAFEKNAMLVTTAD